MAVDKSGNVYVTGYTTNSVFNPTDEDFLTIKYNSSGNLEWERAYGGPDWNNHSEDRAYAIVVDDSGNVYVTGYSQKLIKLMICLCPLLYF